MAANIAPTMKNYSAKSVLKYIKKTKMPTFRTQPCFVRLQLTIWTKCPRT